MTGNQTMTFFLIVCWLCLSNTFGIEAPKGLLRSHITGGYKGPQSRNAKSAVDCKEFSSDYDILYHFPFLIMINPINQDWTKSVAHMNGDGSYVHQLILRQEDAMPPSLFCLRNLQYLGIYNVPFPNGVVPDSLGNLKRLQTLAIQNSNIVNMTERLGGLTNLYDLSITSCALTNLPDLSELQLLSYVQLSANRLSNIDGLTSVQLLYLDNNRFNDIPTLSSPETLQYLYMYNNPLKNMLKITSHTNLQQLYLSNTNQSSIPPAIERLKQLQYLDLSNNKLFFVPNNMLKLTNLKSLDIRGNPFTSTDNQTIRAEFNRVNPNMTLWL